jgi:hypothetical protein
LVHNQKHATSVSIVGEVLRLPARRKRKPRPAFLDKTSLVTFLQLIYMAPTRHGERLIETLDAALRGDSNKTLYV